MGTPTAFPVRIIVRPKGVWHRQNTYSLTNIYHGGGSLPTLSDIMQHEPRLVLTANRFQLASNIRMVILRLGP